MDKKKLEHFKKKLLESKRHIMTGGMLTKGEDLLVSSDDLADEADLASNVITQQISFSIRSRELQKLREIDAALHRVQESTYGHCLECDEDIGEARLEKQPWADLCILHAEERERNKRRFMNRA